jgi:hypothetical protein
MSLLHTSGRATDAMGIRSPPGSFAATFNVASSEQLRDALTTAAINGQADTINRAPGTYSIEGTIPIVAGENFPLTIAEAGTGITIFEGAVLCWGRTDRIQ